MSMIRTHTHTKAECHYEQGHNTKCHLQSAILSNVIAPFDDGGIVSNWIGRPQ
jgi:hypothetical protein